MMRRPFVALALSVVALGMAVVYQSGVRAAGSLTTRIEAFKPVPSGGGFDWVQIPCDGTATLDGVGNVRFRGYATWTGRTALTNERFRTGFNTDAWYILTRPTLPPNQEVMVTDVVQDLDPAGGIHRSQFNVTGGGANLTCTYNAVNVPARSEGLKSDRTSYSDPVDLVRITAERYSDGSPVPCDGSAVPTVGRARIHVFVTNSQAGLFDFHLHQERPLPAVIGPSQMGDPSVGRWWEMGFRNIALQAGVETEITSTTAFATSGPGLQVFHFLQQNGPTQTPIQAFCSWVNT